MPEPIINAVQEPVVENNEERQEEQIPEIVDPIVEGAEQVLKLF